MDDTNKKIFNIPKRERVRTSRTKFSLRGRGCNVPALEARNRWEVDMCIAFMHRKSEEIFAQNEKLQRDQCFSYTDDLGLDHQVSVINFDMTFVVFLCFGGNNLNSIQI